MPHVGHLTDRPDHGVMKVASRHWMVMVGTLHRDIGWTHHRSFNLEELK